MFVDDVLLLRRHCDLIDVVDLHVVGCGLAVVLVGLVGLLVVGAAAGRHAVHLRRVAKVDQLMVYPHLGDAT